MSDSVSSSLERKMLGVGPRKGFPRSLEVPLALIGLICFSPLMFAAAIAVAITSRGPVIFRQTRVGLNGLPFTLYKYRTMRVDAHGPPVTAFGDPRVTAVGKVLRKTKIDELPELWNVLKGDMSLVGARPEVETYVDLLNPSWRFVLRERPGMTDPVTLRLRNEESLLAEVSGSRERFYLDVLQPFKLEGYVDYYRRLRSWQTDLTVLLKTALAVVLPGRAAPPTMPELARFVDRNHD